MALTQEQLWKEIEKAGGIRSYVHQQLKERGFLVARRDTDKMSSAELKRYKHTLKKEAEERHNIKREAWAAYKTTHIVHLGDGVYWNDHLSADRWDLPDTHQRLVENHLPVLTKVDALAEALGLWFLWNCSR